MFTLLILYIDYINCINKIVMPLY
uniref:Uncharacterized protein n=1 Tax=Heterorhabditis bacteriophora TaxID=37862 RepID=A0A1I7WL52_HETBA